MVVEIRPEDRRVVGVVFLPERRVTKVVFRVPNLSNRFELSVQIGLSHLRRLTGPDQCTDECPYVWAVQSSEPFSGTILNIIVVGGNKVRNIPGLECEPGCRHEDKVKVSLS